MNQSIDLKIGDIIELRLTPAEGMILKNGFSDRRKFFIILGIDNDRVLLGGVVINSVINPRLPELVKIYHYPISSTSYSFLRHNSFIDCSSLFKPSLSKIENAILIGKLNTDDYNNVKQAVCECPLIPRIDLKRFGLI